MKEEIKVMIQHKSDRVWEEIKDVRAVEISTRWTIELDE